MLLDVEAADDDVDEAVVVSLIVVDDKDVVVVVVAEVVVVVAEVVVDEEIVYGCVSMPSNVFATTGTNVSILFIDKQKEHYSMGSEYINDMNNNSTNI